MIPCFCREEQKHNAHLLQCLYSKEKIQNLKVKLDTYKQWSTPPSVSETVSTTLSSVGDYFLGSSSASSGQSSRSRFREAQMRAYYASQYAKVQRQLEEEIHLALETGRRELSAANNESVGGILTVVYNIKEHLGDHLTTANRRMASFEGEVKKHLNGRLSVVQIQMMMQGNAAKPTVTLSSLRNLAQKSVPTFVFHSVRKNVLHHI